MTALIAALALADTLNLTNAHPEKPVPYQLAFQFVDGEDVAGKIDYKVLYTTENGKKTIVFRDADMVMEMDGAALPGEAMPEVAFPLNKQHLPTDMRADGFDVAFLTTTLVSALPGKEVEVGKDWKLDHKGEGGQWVGSATFKSLKDGVAEITGKATLINPEADVPMTYTVWFDAKTMLMTKGEGMLQTPDGDIKVTLQKK